MIITSVPKDDCNKGIGLYEDTAFLYIGTMVKQPERIHGAETHLTDCSWQSFCRAIPFWKVYRLRMRLFVPVSRESEKYDYPEREGLLIERT